MRFANFEGIFWSFCSVNHLSGPLRKQMFICDWCSFIDLVCFCVSRFAACDRPVSHFSRQWSTNFLRSFLWSFLFSSFARKKQLFLKMTRQVNYIIICLVHVNWTTFEYVLFAWDDMEVRLSSRALARPGLSVEPSSCQTKFLFENWPFQCEEEIKLDNENRTN